MDIFRGDNYEDIHAKNNADYPLLFPPALWHRPKNGEAVLINQVGACLVYLGDVLGYAPQTIQEKARANAIMMNAIDYIADGRVSFHPVQNTLSYYKQKEEGDRVSKEFSQTRMIKYLYHFQKVVLVHGPQKPVAGGPHVTYADFCLFHVLDATQSQFNNDFYEHAWDRCAVPALKEYHAWMKGRPNLQKYFASDRCAGTWIDVATVFVTHSLTRSPQPSIRRQ